MAVFIAAPMPAPAKASALPENARVQAAPGMIELSGNPVDAGSLAAQCLWLKQHEPYHFQRAARLMTPQDFIGYWLTGEAGIEAEIGRAHV